MVNLILLGTSGEPEPAPALSGELQAEDLEGEIATLLPQVTRQDDDVSQEPEPGYEDELDPFAPPMELLGVITGGKKDLAIIKARQTTYIVSTGEQIAGGWELVEINRTSVRLKNGTEEVVIGLGAMN